MANIAAVLQELLERTRRIETRQYRHAELQGFDISETGDRKRVRFDARFNLVVVETIEVKISTVVRLLRELGVKGEVKVYKDSTYVMTVNAEAT